MYMNVIYNAYLNMRFACRSKVERVASATDANSRSRSMFRHEKQIIGQIVEYTCMCVWVCGNSVKDMSDALF